MPGILPPALDARLDQVIEEVVAPQAAAVDADGAFPKAAVEALAEAGLLALTVPTQYGGAGLGLDAAADLVRRLATACSSTAMVVTMHYSGTAMLVTAGHAASLTAIAEGRHLTTLAFSERGSRSQFWAPMSTATADGDAVVLDAFKSWVTSAHHADSYVWSSRPLAADGAMTLWYLDTTTAGLSSPEGFDGLGLRGNDSCPVMAESVRVPRDAMLGADGAGLDLALGHVLPVFLVLNASASLGAMQALTTATAAHLTGTSLEHLGQSLAQQLPGRTRLAQMSIETDRTRAQIADAIAAAAAGLEVAPLLVLQTKAAADQSVALVSDLAMTACGGAAFRKELAVERRFRDARAARVMAPTTDALLDIVGRALTGLPLLGDA
ncbi:MAG TPA: acyl-CoA dehydrogenase family protein [Nocardioides sp.]|nr:acyl-CoA dehydrogenase family protein [Nocardioides sp.]